MACIFVQPPTLVFTFIATASISGPAMLKSKAQHAPDSLAANTRKAKLLATLFENGEIKRGDKRIKWCKHKRYVAEFQCIDTEKFRKRMKKLLDAKYGTLKNKRKGKD